MELLVKVVNGFLSVFLRAWGQMDNISRPFSYLNPFLVYISISCSLKKLENQRFCGVFRGIKWEHWTEIT